MSMEERTALLLGPQGVEKLRRAKVLLFGLGGLFVAPYTHATEAELYSALRAKAIASGAVTEAELAGPSLYD